MAKSFRRTLTLTAAVFAIWCSPVSAAPVTTADYGLSEINGNWVWGDYDLNRVFCCGALGSVDNVADLAIVEEMMRDGLPAESPDSGTTDGDGNGPGGSTGVYRWPSTGSSSLDFAMNGGADSMIEGMRVWISRSYSTSTEVAVQTRLNGGSWGTQFASTTGVLGFANNQTTATPFDLTFSSILADEVRLLIGPSGSQVAVNDLLLLGETEVSAIPVPAAFPLLAGGLGLFGFMGWRRKRKAAAAA